MHPLAAKTVRRVLTAGATLDPVEAFDDLVALDAAARGSAELSIGAICDLLDRPVIVGDPYARHGVPAVLWRPSYAAIEWISDTATQCGRWQDLCVAWALAHARTPRLLRRLGCSPRHGIRAAHAWASKLNCSIGALLTATAGVLDENSRQPNEKPATPGALPSRAAERLILARLVKEFGQDEDYWLFGPRARTDAALDLLRRMDEAESRAMAKATGKTEARDPQSPEVLAFRRWQAAREAFLAKYIPKGTP